MAAAEKAAAGPKKKPSAASGKKIAVIAGCVALLAVLGVCTYGFILKGSDTIFPNVYVAGVNVGGLKRDAAINAVKLAVEQETAADTLTELLDTFGVELPEPKVELPLGLLGVAAGLVAYTGDDVDEAAAKILEARAEARAAKNWDLADAIRDQLKDLGLTIEDTAAGTRIKSL